MIYLDYIYNKAGTYSFTATVDDHIFADGKAPVITVHVVDGAIISQDSSNAFISETGEALDRIYKENDVYDATGCVLLAENVASNYTLTGIHPAPTGMAGKTVPEATTAPQNITVINGTGQYIVAGNRQMPHHGDRYVSIDGYNGIGICGGGYSSSTDYEESGNTVMDITGKIVLTNGIYSGGYTYHTGDIVTTTGDSVTLNIFNLDKDSVIPKIVRGDNRTRDYDSRTLIVNLDKSSEALKDVVVYDVDNTKIFIGDYDAATGEFTNLVEWAPAADYSAVETAKKKVDALDRSLYTEASLKVVDDAVAAVVKGLTVKEQATVDDYAAAIEDAIADLAFNIVPVITAVDKTGLVFDTAFPYNDENNDSRWSTNVHTVVENPVFYDTLTVTVNGDTEVLTDVVWNCIDESGYVASGVGNTYHFQPVIPVGYEWGCEIPTINVKVFDGAVAHKSAHYGTLSADGFAMNLVIKHYEDANKNQIYDATGCNMFFNTNAMPTGVSSGLYAVAGLSNYSTGLVNKTAYRETTSGDYLLTVTGNANISAVTAGNINAQHVGNTTIVVNDATITTVYAGAYADGTFDNKDVYGIYEGTGTKTVVHNANIEGNTTIDVSGKAVITTITGSGYLNAKAGSTASLTGDGINTGIMTVKIHDLTEGASIGTITRGTATKLVVYLDAESAHILESVVFDANTTVYIEGEPITYETVLLANAIKVAEAKATDTATYVDVSAVATALEEARASYLADDTVKAEKANALLDAVDALEIKEKNTEVYPDYKEAWDASWTATDSGLPEVERVAELISQYRNEGYNVIVGYGASGKVDSRATGTQPAWLKQSNTDINGVKNTDIISRAKDPWVQYYFTGDRFVVYTSKTDCPSIVDVYVNGVKYDTIDISKGVAMVIADTANYEGLVLNEGVNCLEIRVVGFGTANTQTNGYQYLWLDQYTAYNCDVVGKKALAELASQAASVMMTGEGYTEEQLTSISTACSTADTVLNDETATQVDVTTAVNNLKSALNVQ